MLPLPTGDFSKTFGRRARSLASSKHDLDEEITHLEEILHDPNSSDELKYAMADLVNVIGGLSRSFSAGLRGRRSAPDMEESLEDLKESHTRIRRRTQVIDCSDLDIIIAEYGKVITWVTNILKLLSDIGTSTSNDRVNAFVEKAIAVYGAAAPLLQSNLAHYENLLREQSCPSASTALTTVSMADVLGDVAEMGSAVSAQVDALKNLLENIDVDEGTKAKLDELLGNLGDLTSSLGNIMSLVGRRRKRRAVDEVPSQDEFCAISSEHTMCKYSGPSGTCTAKTISREFSEEGKQIILDKHNDLRRRVAKGEEGGQPEASNMKKLVWSNQLAAVAQRWADQCTFGHDSERSKTDGTYVGQNAFFGSASQVSDKAAIMAAIGDSAQSWYDEVRDPGFNPDNIDPYIFTKGTGHYTQVVWADTQEVGCGWVYYTEDGWQHSLVVCNYAVGGNMASDPMYKRGTECSSCPTGFTCDDGLCASENVQALNSGNGQNDSNGNIVNGNSGSTDTGNSSLVNSDPNKSFWAEPRVYKVEWVANFRI